MRFSKKFLCFITALFLLAAVFAGKKESEPDGFLSVDVFYEDRTENVRCWNWEDAYYLYLPGGVELQKMQLRFSGDSSWTLDGRPLTDRMPCEEFSLDTPFVLTENGEYAGTVTFAQSAGAGTMFLETASGNMKHIHAVKGNEESGVLRLYTQEGDLNHSGVLLSINGRGNSTWNEEKKSYSVELAAEADLLHMGSAKKWILLSNALDTTNLHNKIVYEFARDFGLDYSPQCDWVDLYLNGEYAGLYLLCERNEVHPERVDISQKDSFLVARDAYWRFDEFGKPYITTENKAALRIYHAGMDTGKMLTLWQSAENAILREDGVDPVTGKSWQELIDMESWVRKYLVDEVFGNKDGTALSQFYYYDGSDGAGKIYAGPVWDYDLSMDFDLGDKQESIQQFYANVPGVYGSLWPSALYQKEEYYNSIVRLYALEILPLLKTYQQTVIPAYANRIASAAAMNATRWGIGKPEEQVQTIYDFLSMRTAFLNDIWLEETAYCMINALDVSAARHYYAVKPGNVLPSPLRYESFDENYAYIWYDSETGNPYPVDEPIYADLKIHVCYEPVVIPEETDPVDAPVDTDLNTRVYDEPVVIPEQTASAEIIVQENIQPAEESFRESAPKERLPVIRLLPAVLFTGMLLLVAAVGIYQIFADRKKR